MVHSPENRSTGISQAWRKLVSQQPEKAKDKFAGTCCIGHNFGWIQPGLLFQKTFQHKDRVPQRPRYNDAMKAGILIGHKVVPGDPSVITIRILRAPLSHLRKAEREDGRERQAHEAGARTRATAHERTPQQERQKAAREAERGREAWTLGQGMKKPVAGCYGRLTRWKGGGDVVYMALL